MAERRWRVPARIETARLVLRCYEPADAATMDVVIPANKTHLETFMPWATDEPLGTDKRRELVDKFIADYKAGDDFVMGIFDRASGAYLGGTGLHTRQGPDVLEIGYWLAEDAQGHGFMTEGAAALTRVAITYTGAPRVEIRCDPVNVRSRNVPQRLGFQLEDTRVAACGADGHQELAEIWVLTPNSFLDAAASAAPLPHLFDGIGSPLAWPV